MVLSHAFAEEEVERFTYRMPGQATSYFYGYTRLISLREETEKALSAKGVKFEEYDMPGLKTVDGIANAGGAKAAWFKDTEGNILAIVQTMRA